MRSIQYFGPVIAALVLCAMPAAAQVAPQASACTGKPGIDWDTQIKSCTAVIQSAQETAHNRASAYLNRGGVWNAKGDYDRAIADLNEAIKLDPKFALLYASRSAVWNALGKYDRAVSDAGEAIRLDPTFANAYLDRSAAWFGKRDYDRAISDAGEAIRLDPKFSQAYVKRSGAWDAKGDYDRAIADADEAIRLDPKLSGAYINRSAARLGKRDYDRAIADADEAIRLDPKSEVAYNNRSAAWAYKRDYDRAIADANEAIGLDPKFPQPYVNRGKLYEIKGDYDHAVADYNEAIRRDATFSKAYTDRSALYEALDHLARTYLQLGELDRALAGYNAVLKLNPKLANSLYGRGITEIKKGDASAGNTDITAAKAIRPDVAVEFAKLGISEKGEIVAPEAADAPQYAGLHEQDPVTKKYTAYVGSIVWHVQSAEQGQNAGTRVDASFEIPDHFGGTISFTRTLPASFVVEIAFRLPADFAFGGIANIPGILTAAAPPAQGVPIFGQFVAVTPGKFSMALAAVYVQRNLQMLRDQPRIQIPIVYTNGRRAVLVIAKGSPGQLALGAWTTQAP
jgi:tetratricopeptide (TPR) repeat protein